MRQSLLYLEEHLQMYPFSHVVEILRRKKRKTAEEEDKEEDDLDRYV